MHYWTTKDGKEMPISKMTDTHLLNTIKMLDRYYKGGIVVCGGHYYEEGDGDFWEEEISEKEAKRIDDDYSFLKAEAKKRGLLNKK